MRIRVSWPPYLATPSHSKGASKKESPYFVLEKFILYTSHGLFKASDCKYEFRICKFYHAWQIRNFKVSSNVQKKGLVHPGHQ